ncbi:hypothetical protein [Sulfurovum mangrovi]|uniref:hypothetical protein n=1 Tax=Sulfurovum mangrovi TaxID=2893889 RepID=UPI001E3DE7BA|nr:hypothetical protein [Sulfurovum mangrovi]UFH60399.1 hypothetical protein LN246_05970 [Sulfurovum mangrovi]
MKKRRWGIVSILLVVLILNGCATLYNDLPFKDSTSTLQLKVVTRDSKLFNRYKVYLGDGQRALGYIDVESGKRKISTDKPLYLTIEHYHALSKIVKHKSFILHPERDRDYVVLIELREYQNYIHLKEFRSGRLQDVDIDRIELR